MNQSTANSDVAGSGAASKNGVAAVRIAWRKLGGGGLVSSALIFAVMLLVLAVREGAFQAIHRMLMVVVAAGMLYFVVARRLNATQLSVRGGTLRVSHGPLPLRSPLSAPLEMIAEVRCDKHGRRLVLRTKQGEDVILLEDMPPKLLDEVRSALRDRLGLTLVT